MSQLYVIESEEPYETESLIVNIALYILSGTLFGFIWQYSILRNISRVSNFKHPKLHFVLGLLFFGLFGYLGVSFFIASRHFYTECKTRGVKCVDLSILHLILGLCGLNFVSLIILQHQLNKLHGNL